MIVKDGIFYGAGLCAAGACAAYLGNVWWGLPFWLVGAFCVYFFRDPDREIPEGPVAVSPADGKVVHIRRWDDGKQRISIFLNIFDVHVNRIPVTGKVVERVYTQGKYMMAHREEASSENEQNSLTIESGATVVTVRQIAGLIARRIVCTKDLGDEVHKGERFGLIKFGSRTDLYLGPEWDLLVKPGDKVRGGSSILARLRQ
jgi:phosphatidylserine decarboxylase